MILAFLAEWDFQVVLIEVFLSLCALALVGTLLPNSAYLKLTREGFIVRSLYRTHPVTPWTAVGAFQAIVIPPVLALVLFNFSSDYSKARAVRKLVKTMLGYDGMLPDTYGLAAQDLARLLNVWKAHQSAPASGRKASTAASSIEAPPGEVYVLSGFDNEANYLARKAFWEPDQSFMSVALAEEAARAWLASQGSESQVEIILVTKHEGNVVEVVTQTGTESIQ